MWDAKFEDNSLKKKSGKEQGSGKKQIIHAEQDRVGIFSKLFIDYFLPIFRYPGYMICIPTLNGLNFEHFPLKTSLSLFTLSGSHQRRFFPYIPGNKNQCLRAHKGLGARGHLSTL
jgi:hypothetical protein